MSCENQKTESDDVITPCEVQDNVVEEIKDFQTRLYFIAPDPTGMGIRLPQGLLYNVSEKTAYLPYSAQDKSYSCIICNFPDYAKSWDLQPKVDPYWEEDGINVVLSGKIYSKIDYVTHKLELTSLKKGQP